MGAIPHRRGAKGAEVTLCIAKWSPYSVFVTTERVNTNSGQREKEALARLSMQAPLSLRLLGNDYGNGQKISHKRMVPLRALLGSTVLLS